MSDSDPTPPPPPPGRNPRIPGSGDGGWPKWSMWILFAVVLVLIGVGTSINDGSVNKLEYSVFKEMVADRDVKTMTYDNTTAVITGELTSGAEYEVTGPSPLPDADQVFFDDNNLIVEYDTPTSNIFLSLGGIFLPFLIILGIFWWLARRQQSQMGGIMSIGRSKAKTYSAETPGTTFADVAGYESVKLEITEVVDFLKNPDKFADIGARIPKGILLVGPPGTGKTLIARAVAGEAGVPFFSVTGSDFMEMFVGVGASRVRDLFAEARKVGRAIIFVDEIDSIGRKRGSGLGGGHDEREQTLNQMLSEMDGFEATEGIVMMAATNRPDILDTALLRPGRFDRQVVVPLPELGDRKKILEVHIKHKRIEDSVDVGLIARGTPGMSGADLANLVNEAALYAVRNGASSIGAEHFDMARDRVIMGVKRDSLVMTESERELTAYHEAGHALMAAVLPDYDPLHKVTIIPTGMALGVTMTLPENDRHSMRRTEAENMIVMALGGRNAEQLVFDVVSSGAANDLQQATNIARRMVTDWGMSDKVGPMSFSDSGPMFMGDDMMGGKDYSQETARVLDEETQRILLESEDRCRRLLTEHRKALNLIARGLLEHETLSGAEVNRLISLADTAPPTPSPTAQLESDTDESTDTVTVTDSATEAEVEAEAEAASVNDGAAT